MLGGIVGDIAGSILENGDQELRTYNLTTDTIFSPRAVPTDDSVLLAATGAAMLDNSDDFELYYKKFAERHPDAGYGPGFQLWLNGDSQEYQSFGNGAASRAGILGYLDNEQDVLRLARKSAMVSHKHAEGIAGAEAMAWCVWAIRHEYSREEIRIQVYKRWNYYIGRDSHDLKAIHKDSWNFDCSAVNTVPLALHIALFQASDYESAIRTCQYLGGDVDTIACMAGLLKSQESMINGEWTRRSKQKLWLVAPKILDVVERFDARFDGGFATYPNIPF